MSYLTSDRCGQGKKKKKEGEKEKKRSPQVLPFYFDRKREGGRNEQLNP